MPGTRKLGKTTDQRMAMLRQQVTDLLDNGKMETTVTRAKEIKPLAEKMITLGKKGDLAAYRQAMAFITREDVCKKTFKELAPRSMLSATAAIPASSAPAFAAATLPRRPSSSWSKHNSVSKKSFCMADREAIQKDFLCFSAAWSEKRPFSLQRKTPSVARRSASEGKE